jgi:hypothetical protein
MEWGGDSDPSIVGDECHIVSSKPNGPRHVRLDDKDYDAVENLILLCKIHHKVVDDRVDLYPTDALIKIKREHESWVDQMLRTPADRKGDPPVRLLKRIEDGTSLTKLMGGCHAYLFDNEPPESEEEAEAIGSFHQDVFDWGEIWNGMQPTERVSAGFSMNQHFADLEKRGLWVFASVARYRTKYANGTSSSWPTLVLTVVRPSNPGITPLGELATVISPTAVS